MKTPMKGTRTTATGIGRALRRFALAGTLIAAAAPLAAQDGRAADRLRPGIERAARPVRAQRPIEARLLIETALRAPAFVGIEEGQAERLRALRERARQDGEALRTGMRALADAVRTGDLTVDQVRERKRALAASRTESARELHQALEGVLTEVQRARARMLADHAADRIRDRVSGRRGAGAGDRIRSRRGPGRDAPGAEMRHRREWRSPASGRPGRN